jgi:hypothetical protein
MGFIDRMKALLRRLLIRSALLVAGSAALIISVWINLNAGNEILSGLLSPESPEAIAVSIAS